MVAALNPLVRPRVVYRAIGPGPVIKNTAGLAVGSKVMSGAAAHIVAGRRSPHPADHTPDPTSRSQPSRQ